MLQRFLLVQYLNISILKDIIGKYLYKVVLHLPQCLK